MFSNLPPYINIETTNIMDSVIRAYQVYHSTVNDASYLSDGSMRKHESHCIFHYTIKGSGQVIYKGVPYLTHAGEGFFNIINQDDSGYGYPQDCTGAWEFVVICFNGGNIRQVVENILDNSVIYKIKNTEVFGMMCNKLSAQQDTETILTFFPRLLSLIDNSTELPDLSRRFQSLVEKELLSNPTIYALASQLNISREHLQREYIKQTGNTPSKYIANKRFEKLCYLLNTNMTEAEIAETMHFPSVVSMTLFFKRFSGTTPLQYRKNGYFTV